MKTERVTLLTSPEFKTFLATEAKREKVSVAELVRSRCERRPTEDEVVLVALTAELHSAVVRAKKSLREGRITRLEAQWETALALTQRAGPKPRKLESKRGGDER